jgi:hypothetical protein
MKVMKEKFVKKYKFEYLFGERYLAFVQFLDSVTVREIEDELFWAKAYFPIAFDGKGIIVRCHVKTFEWKHFIKKNKKRLMEFSADESLGQFVSIKTDKNTTTIFNI